MEQTKQEKNKLESYQVVKSKTLLVERYDDGKDISTIYRFGVGNLEEFEKLFEDEDMEVIKNE